MTKKNILLFYVFICSVPISLTNCNSRTEKINKESQTSLVDESKSEGTSIDHSSGQKEVNSDFQKFIREADAKIQFNEKTISQLKLQSLEKKMKVKNEKLLRIAELEKRNMNLKLKLENYVQYGSGNWYTFRKEFYNELNKLEIDSSNALLAQIR